MRIEWPLHVVRRVAVSVALAAVVAVGGYFGVSWYQRADARCADGVVKQGPAHECVGVTDGSYAFADDLKGVEGRIRKENARVAKEAGGDYVSIAYMTTMTLTAQDSNSRESIRHELEGAYLAQYRHNRGDIKAAPPVRLLIANTGSEAAYWKHTVGELVARRDEDHLVAVTGLGPSTGADLAAVRELSRHRLALVASTMTADNITNIKNLVRVTPTNTDEARAAAAYLKSSNAYRTAAVVQDAAAGNLYASSLGKAFVAAYPDAHHALVRGKAVQTYDSSVGESWETELDLITTNLCDAKPQLIYFAGRGIHLTRFLQALAHRSCDWTGFTVMTGDDTTNLTADRLHEAARTGIPVLYTGLAHPDMYRETAKDGRRVVDTTSAAAFGPQGPLAQWFPSDPRDDGQAMMAHDAVLTAEKGAALADRGQGVPHGDAVARMFEQMQGNNQVPGAGGFLTFREDGSPVNKAVPILRLDKDGTSAFVEVSAAGGTPQPGR
ncbi:ABC transporter substrate-binding protein [Streptomyces fuscigenes]|uniref:ABC transporter substrate-binding protein n=1 Tax=Streptomyces fuscigenes TaxID=1528880 RepID=UPI001F21947A|nr:ABC transporter substrate-binding protein [Streptomyces fuscigenes]MCF3961081.1 ABC transporter substrate-binding protein [Streptomyces fuscigenes]